MREVFLVTSSDYASIEIRGVFSSWELAFKHIKKLFIDYSECDIELYLLLEDLEEDKMKDVSHFYVHLNKDIGNSKGISKGYYYDDTIYIVENDDWDSDVRYYKTFVGNSFVSYERAEKMARDIASLWGIKFGEVAQSGLSRSPWTREVAGSNPALPTMKGGYNERTDDRIFF